jgi:deoxyguanosine kinase
MQSPFITIDGNIGAGKSSILLELHKIYKYNVDLEPVDKWLPHLTKLYAEDKGYFEFQKIVWEDRCWLQSKNKDNTPIILERSPFFTRNTFMNVLYNDKKLTDEEMIILNEMYNLTDKLWKPRIYIYLKTSPNISFKRIENRNRTSENLIKFDYIENLHNAYENAYNKGLKQKLNIHIIDTDDKTVEDITNIIYHIIKS